MRRARVDEHTLQLTFYGFSNCYLVREESGLTLIDTSYAQAAPHILAAAAGLGQPIHRILLTHTHPDHIGGLDRLASFLGEVQVAIGEREAALLGGDRTLLPGEPRGRLPRLFYPGAKRQPDSLLRAGDVVGNLECIAAPGHTPGQMCFLDRRSRTLFAGDALYSLAGPLAVCTQLSWCNPLPVFTWDRQLAEQSARELMRHRFLTVAPGHGSVVPDAAPALATALAKLR